MTLRGRDGTVASFRRVKLGRTACEAAILWSDAGTAAGVAVSETSQSPIADHFLTAVWRFSGPLQQSDRREEARAM